MGMSIAPVLTRLEVERIHAHSLDLLETVGKRLREIVEPD
jgi:hypothetical protein